jgi:SAM-dependent methyltransferase
MNPDHMKEFLDSGKENVELISKILDKLGVTWENKTVMDYGVGTGRIAHAVATQTDCKKIYAVDISKHHLEITEAFLKEIGVHNVECVFIANPYEPLPGPYDIVYSFITLQHNRPTCMRKCIENILNGLAPGGIAILHIPFELPYSNIDNTNIYAMEMHGLPLQELQQDIGPRSNCKLVHVEDIDMCGGGIKNAVFCYRKQENSDNKI